MKQSASTSLLRDGSKMASKASFNNVKGSSSIVKTALRQLKPQSSKRDSKHSTLVATQPVSSPILKDENSNFRRNVVSKPRNGLITHTSTTIHPSLNAG